MKRFVVMIIAAGVACWSAAAQVNNESAVVTGSEGVIVAAGSEGVATVTGSGEEAAAAAVTPEAFRYTGAARPDFNEISVSYGIGNVPEVVWIFTDVFTAIGAGLSGGKLENARITGAIGLEYQRYLANGRVTVGAALGYEYMSADLVNKQGESTPKRTNVLTLMPTVKAMWFNRKNVGMYSRFGLGVTGMVGDINAVLPAFQLNPIGLEAGGEHLRFFIESGFGSQGTILFGLKTTF